MGKLARASWSLGEVGQMPIKELISFTCQGCITVYFFKVSAYITSSSDFMTSSVPRNYEMNI